MFEANEVAAAAGIAPSTLADWIKRRQLMLVKPDDGVNPGTGRSRRFTLRRALQIALTAELTRRGLALAEAGRAAAHFTDVGETVAFFEGDGAPANMRLPGELFRDGMTLLRVLFRDDGEVDSDVIRATDLPSLFARHTKVGSSVLVLDVNTIYYRVLHTLGLGEVSQ